MTPSDLNKIAEFRRMIKNYLKMKVIKKRTIKPNNMKADINQTNTQRYGNAKM